MGSFILCPWDFFMLCPWAFFMLCPWDFFMLCPWDFFMLCPWAFCREAIATPLHPRRPVRPGAVYFSAVCGWRWRRCDKVFLQISPLFCGKICKKLYRGLPHWGTTIVFVPPQFSFPIPLSFPDGGMQSGCGGIRLSRLFYGSWELMAGVVGEDFAYPACNVYGR